MNASEFPNILNIGIKIILFNINFTDVKQIKPVFLYN